MATHFLEPNMRRLTSILLEVYIVVSIYVLLRALVGLSFLILPAILLSLLGFSFALLHASTRQGWQNAFIFLGLTVVISLLFESVGVATGWLYGGYHYTEEFGPRIFGLVPYLIPVNWFMMLYPSYVMAERIFPRERNRWKQWIAIAAVGGVIMTAWDLVMDPLMVVRGHWVWENEGAFFGIPLQNFFGWWLTSFTILAIYHWGSHRWGRRIPLHDLLFDHQAITFYAVTGFGSVIGALLAGLNGPALAGFFAMLPWVLVSRKEQ
ncbi:MAG: carotenoid biosynthesis protein [Anaerolineales bacterium]|nr:carotenoid biosynthesis protein [Anaerolineales bacterium]